MQLVSSDGVDLAGLQSVCLSSGWSGKCVTHLYNSLLYNVPDDYSPPAKTFLLHVLTVSDWLRVLSPRILSTYSFNKTGTTLSMTLKLTSYKYLHWREISWLVNFARLAAFLKLCKIVRVTQHISVAHVIGRWGFVIRGVFQTKC